MPNTYQVNSFPSRTPLSPSQTQPTAFYHPNHARISPVVDGSPDGFQMEVAGRRKKRMERPWCIVNGPPVKFGLTDRGGGC
jgi:hypothetical protein